MWITCNLRQKRESEACLSSDGATDTALSPHNRELKRERAWSRIHLIPLLMAEADRDAFRREQAQLEREKEIMKDVPGWEVSTCIGPSVVPVLFNSSIANSHNPCSFFSSFRLASRFTTRSDTLPTTSLYSRTPHTLAPRIRSNPAGLEIKDTLP